MEPLTLDQQKAMALAAARARAAGDLGPPQHRSLGQNITGAMANLNRGLGIGDEMAAGFATAGDVLTGKSGPNLVQTFRDEMKRQRGTEDSFAEVHPMAAALARGTGNALITAPALLATGGGAAAAPGIIGGAARGATGAGLAGAAYGAADRGGPVERLRGASSGAVTGAVIGSVAGAAGGLVRAAPRAAQKLAAVLKGGLDAGATPAAQKLQAAALAKVLAQQEALSGAETTAASLKAADEPLREAMEAAASKQAAKGVGVSDTPEAQALVSHLKDRLNPSGPVVTVPTDDQAKAYNSIIQALSPTQGGQKPSLEMVQAVRRKLADTAYGTVEPSGFGAIGKLDKRNLIDRLHEVESAYTGGASAPVRENWAAAMQAQDKADELAPLRDTLKTQVAQLTELPPKAAVARARAIVTSLSNKGLVSEDDYREFLQLANAATDARGKAAFRQKLLFFGIGSAGASAAAGSLGLHAIGAHP